ncbi:MAG: glucose-6-phosphate isomerase, partial [Deltaproteobacteria bacterium]|nr:glucose-6-phosphate isomerase [Deltaproteobacteria bacterium]
MLPKINPIKTKSWDKLTDHYEKIKNVHMKNLFADDPERFKKFSIRFNDILVDYSK